MKLIIRLALVSALALPICAIPPAPSMSPEAALQELVEGNKRFAEGKPLHAKADLARVTELAKGQAPYAIVLACSDSRLAPEILFDKGLGELFVIRVAGNIPDPVVLGSIEYAAEHLGSPLVIVLGHERCGAVTATVSHKGEPEGNIGAIIKIIQPAAKAAKAAGKGKETAQIVEDAIDINTKLVAANLTKHSKVLAHLVKEGKLKVVSGKYDLDDGKVTLN